MSAETPIKASWFCMCGNEKTKMNWFLFEYACKVYDHIGESRKKTVRKWKARWSDERIAEFCAYFAKRMRQNIYSEPVSNPEEDITTADEFIRDYCHSNTRRETEDLVDVCEAAWLELIRSCSVCPTRCLSEMNGYCELFDRMERGGYLS